MTATVPHRAPPALRHRPKTLTVFAAAFIAGAAVAVGVNRALDVHLAQSKPQVECEPIFVALRSLPQGSPVTVWDVALRDWPKAMVPSTALKSHDTFEGHLLRHPLREGQPLLSVQLMRSAASSTSNDTDPTVIEQPFAPPPPAPAGKDVADASDSWLPGPAPTTIAATERPARIAAGPQAEHVEPTTTPFTATPDQPQPVETPTPENPKPTEPRQPTDVVASTPATIEPQPQLLPTVEPQAVPEPQPLPQSVSRTDVPDTVVAATPPSPELVPYPSVTAPAAPPQPAAQPSRATPAEAATTTIAEPTPDDEPTPAAAATPPTSTPSPVDPASDTVVTTPPTPELKTVLAQNPTTAAQADVPAARTPGQSPNRYLVVPERIALQADVSFVSPPPRDRDDDQVTTQQPQAVEQPVVQQPTRPTPQTTQTPQQKSAQRQTTAGRLPGRSGPAVRSPAAPRATGGGTRQQPGATQPPAGKRPATATAPQTPMFPNIAAGIDALTGGFKRPRDEQRTSPPR